MKSALLLALAATAMSLPDSHTLHQKRDAYHTTRYTKRAAVSGNTNIPFEIALKQRNVEAAEAKLYDM